MDDSKQMFSSKLSSELFGLPVSAVNVGAAQDNLESCINYLAITYQVMGVLEVVLGVAV